MNYFAVDSYHSNELKVSMFVWERKQIVHQKPLTSAFQLNKMFNFCSLTFICNEKISKTELLSLYIVRCSEFQEHPIIFNIHFSYSIMLHQLKVGVGVRQHICFAFSCSIIQLLGLFIEILKIFKRISFYGNK